MTKKAINPPTVGSHHDAGRAATYRQFNTDFSDVQRIQKDREQEYRTEPAALNTKENKKDKKWSIGRLFRRKKKEDDSASSSESEEGNSAKSSSKRQTKKKKRCAAVVNNFDHIVVSRNSSATQIPSKQKNNDFVDDGVLSDPSAGFIGYRGRGIPPHQNFGTSKESLNARDDSGTRSGNVSLDGSIRKGRKGRMKARVEALRNSLRKDSSSDEESQKSSASSSMIRFRSEDSLMNNSRDGLQKKSRSARTERYIKRLSRDDENQLNKEAELLQQGYTKAEIEMLTRTPTSQSSGYGTCKRENQYANTLNANNDLTKRTMKSESISSFPSTHSNPSSITFNVRVNNESINHSIPYTRRSAPREPMYINNYGDNMFADRNRSVEKENVMCIKFPLGNVTNIVREEKAPPVPPPRDLQRKIVTPTSMLHDNEQTRIMRNGSDRTSLHGVVNNDFNRIMRRSQERSLNPTINSLRRPMSSSEDHIAIQSNESMSNYNLRKTDQPRRPASVSAEPNSYRLYANTPRNDKIENRKLFKPEPLKHDFLYYADESPRSRKPISIQSSQNNLEKQYLSDSQTSLSYLNRKSDPVIQRRPRNASDFWRKIDTAECQRKRQNVIINGRIASDPTTFGYNKQNLSPVLIPLKNETVIHKRSAPQMTNNGKWLASHSSSCDNHDELKARRRSEFKKPVAIEKPKIVSPPQRMHIRHKSDSHVPMTNRIPSDEEKLSERRKSTNLDDALNELEAIYNSLGLGDEDLLDRAERREQMTPKFNNKSFDDWNGNDDVQLRSQPSTPLKRHSIQRRSTLPDKLQDDMAFRRMNSKERPVSKDHSGQISYMLASPVYVPYASDDDKQFESDRNEPDIVQDDVVYRNIRHANNHLKLIDPQPPFGIPLGPISPAPQSDYLHATPDNKTRSRFIPRRSPDLVSDDLAYRALRKDNKNSSLFSNDECEGYINNNHSYTDLLNRKESIADYKKKRAVRSLSANIFSMIQKEIDEALNMSKIATLQKTQSNTDVNKTFQNKNGNNGNSQESFPKNRVKQRHNTVNIFVSNAHPHALPFAKDDSFINHDDKYLAKPPTGDKSKSTSPSNRSPQPSKKQKSDDFQQVLTMLAQEAMETSNKLGVALAELDRNRKGFDRKEKLSTNSESRLNFLNSLSKGPGRLECSPEIKLVKVHSEIINERNNDALLLPKEPEKCQSKGQKTEDSLLAISDQLQKVEDKLKHSIEREVNFIDESIKLNAYISEVKEKIKAQECKVLTPENKLHPEIITSNVKEDAVRIQNNKSESNKKADNSDASTDPQSFAKSNIFEETKSYDSHHQIKGGVTNLVVGISEANDEILKSNDDEGINTSNRGSVNISLYDDDLEVNKDTAEPTEYNSSEELATIFNLDQQQSSTAKDETPDAQNEDNTEDHHCDLNSPRLVHSINQQLRTLSTDSTENSQPYQSTSRPTNISVPWRTKKHNSNSQNDKKGET